METDARAVWLDCDPGHDDALALILASFSGRVDLLGVSCCSGNQSLSKTTLNAVRVLRACGAPSLVCSGAPRPLLLSPRVCPEIHGVSGLAFLEEDHHLETLLAQQCENVEDDSMFNAGNGIVLMENAIRKAHREQGRRTVLVATGCLTNTALLLSVFPDIKECVEEIVFLGGAKTTGNMTPSAEFNVLLDPHAAHIVFESGCRVVQIPLEVTHTNLVLKEHLEELQSFQSTFGDMIAALLRFFSTTYEELFQMKNPPLHDPLTIFYVISPESFELDFFNVVVETSSPLTMGATVTDVYRMTKRKPNVHVAGKCDVKAFWKEMIAALRRANESSPLE